MTTHHGNQVTAAHRDGHYRLGHRDVETGLRRIYEYCHSLEDSWARGPTGLPSGVNNILIINKVMTPGRVKAIIGKERVGF